MAAPEIVYDFDPRNLPPELLRAIGLITAASSHTEAIVQSFIGAVLGIDDIETIALTAHMSAPLKDSVARALIELNAAHVAIVDTMDNLLDAIKDAQEARNVVVHNSLARDPATGEVFSYRETARGSLLVSLKPIRIEQIEEDAALIYKVGMDLFDFMILWGLRARHRDRPVRAPLDRKKKTRMKRIEIGTA